MEVQKQGILVISRHTESEWNLLGKWTGWTDVNLTAKGEHEAEQLGEAVRDIHFDVAYTSELPYCSSHSAYCGFCAARAISRI